MVIFGGLEFVVGGYVFYRYQKKKKHLRESADQRRHDTFPGASKPQHQKPPQQQKYFACYASQPQTQGQVWNPNQTPPPAQRPHTAQTFPRTRPPRQDDEPEIIGPLHRTDSQLSTFSNLPVANGPRYRPEDRLPPLPPRRASGLQAVPPRRPVGAPYSNAGFAVSVPSLGAAPMPSPGAAGGQGVGRYTVDDNWETYSPHRHEVGRRDEEDGVDDAPPPYTP